MMTSKWPPLPVTVCATALAASSLARRIASSRTGHGARTRRVKSRALAIWSVRPGKTRRLERAVGTAAPSWPETVGADAEVTLAGAVGTAAPSWPETVGADAEVTLAGRRLFSLCRFRQKQAGTIVGVGGVRACQRGGPTAGIAVAVPDRVHVRRYWR